MQLSILGGLESRSGMFAASVNENTVLFDAHQQAAFARLRATLEKLRSERFAPDAQPVFQAVGVADEIAKLAKLTSEGILTEDEFDAKKRSLLGVRLSTRPGD